MKQNKFRCINGCLMFVVLILLTACQPTPEEEIVVNKGDGALEIKLQATPVPPEEAQAFAVPDCWQETLEIGDSRVVFDAAVECPVTAFPVFEVEEASFTAQTVNEGARPAGAGCGARLAGGHLLRGVERRVGGRHPRLVV